MSQVMKDLALKKPRVIVALKNLSGRQIISIIMALVCCVIMCSVNALCLTAVQMLTFSVVLRA